MKAGSVPFSRSTWYWSGVSSARQSASVLGSSVMVLSFPCGAALEPGHPGPSLQV